MSTQSECSLMGEISKTEEAIKACYERVHLLEQKIESDSITNARKNNIRKELLEVRKLLTTNETQLSQLHKHNRKSFAFISVFCFICFSVYAIYVLVHGPDF